MARETKEERLVRNMQEQVSEHLHELKNLMQNPSAKERDIEIWCQSILKTCLGYSATNGYTILAQEAKGKMRPDLIVSKNDKPIFVVEIKKLGFDLNKSDFRSGKTQLTEYLKNIGNVKYGILCNGYQWKLFDFSDVAVGGIEIVSFDLRDEGESIDTTKRACEDTCWNFLDLHEATYNNKTWEEYSKEATAFSPESLARAILSIDSVKYIARVIRGEHEYKANTEVLIDRIYHLLENGLDDTVSCWNDVKIAEMNKYTKSQKRIGRNKRKAIKENTKADVITSPTTEIVSDKQSVVAMMTDDKKVG